jgi:hypothetical protein
MTSWKRGEATIRELLERSELQRVTGAMTDGQAWLTKAERTLSTAATIADDDPESGLILAYDAGRQIGTGLLAQQGLRPTTAGGHLAVVKAAVAQFGGPFTALERLRRRRNELQYPSFPSDVIDPDEAHDAISKVRGILTAAPTLLPELGMFSE